MYIFANYLTLLLVMYPNQLFQRLTAIGLSLCLQSCILPLQLAYKPQTPDTCPEDRQNSQVVVQKETSQTTSLTPKYEPRPCLQLGSRPAAFTNNQQVFTSASGETISFFQAHGLWKATIQDSYLGVGINKPLPVICEQRESLPYILQSLPQEASKHRIHVLDTPLGKGIFVGAVGLKGGMELEAKEIASTDQDWLSQGEACCNLGKYTDAIACFDKILAIDSTHIHALIQKGICLAALSQNQEALEVYDLALTIDSQDASAYYRMIATFHVLGDEEVALKALDEAPMVHETDYFAYFNKGYALSVLGQKEAAIECYNMAIELNPNYVKPYTAKGIDLYELGQYEAAIICFDKAIALNPNYVDAYHNKGVTLYDLGQVTAGIACFDKVIALNPNYPETYYNKGVALYELEQYEAAIACFSKVIELKPTDAEAYISKGHILDKLGKADEAKDCCDKANKLKQNAA
jgi:tetratricopeptide (TPR) repeat protein